MQLLILIHLIRFKFIYLELKKFSKFINSD